MAALSLYNTLTRQKEPFTPIDEKNIRIYACGPTVYDRPHLGNARAVVVYDVLVRLLKALYGQDHVTYVRNITDVDDKINKAAKDNGETIQALTRRITEFFHADIAALHCQPPTHEPRATEFVNKQGGPANKTDHMVAMIQRLIDQGHAYAKDGHVLFDVTSYNHYGKLSGRTIEDQQAGARIAVEGYKKNAGDFILWKPANEGDDPSSIFESPWGNGRPGWHIECSVMSTNFLGQTYDIHGGGADLKFPHHENEIAQACCANPQSDYANYWVHNGFLTVEGEKMSKSLGNFTTVRELLDQGIPGEVIRYVFLSTHYRKPLDWNDKAIYDANKSLHKFYTQYHVPVVTSSKATLSSEALPTPKGIAHAMRALEENPQNNPFYWGFLNKICDDMNIPAALASMHSLLSLGDSTEENCARFAAYEACSRILGINNMAAENYMQTSLEGSRLQEVEALIDARNQAKKAKDFTRADQIRNDLLAQGIELIDSRDGSTKARRINNT